MVLVKLKSVLVKMSFVSILILNFKISDFSKTAFRFSTRPGAQPKFAQPGPGSQPAERRGGRCMAGVPAMCGQGPFVRLGRVVRGRTKISVQRGGWLCTAGAIGFVHGNGRLCTSRCPSLCGGANGFLRPGREAVMIVNSVRPTGL